MAANEPNLDIVLRPSVKLLLVSYAILLILALAVATYWNQASPPPPVAIWWPLAVPGLLLLWTMQRHLTRLSTKLSVAGDRLRYESGIFSKTSRTMEIHKVQDVRVDQTIGQRLLAVGNLSIETAGDASRITIENIDSPQKAAEKILDLARHNK